MGAPFNPQKHLSSSHSLATRGMSSNQWRVLERAAPIAAVDSMPSVSIRAGVNFTTPDKQQTAHPPY